MPKPNLHDSILHTPLAGWLTSALDVPCPDPEQRRRGRLLNVLIWALLLASIVAALVKTPGSPQGFLLFSSSHLPASALVLVLLFVILGLNRSGRVRLASVLYLGLFVATVSFMFRIQDLDRIMVLYIVPTMGASFLLAPASSFVFATLSILGYSLAYGAFPADVSYNYVSGIGLYLTALVAWLAATSLESALREIRQRADELDRRVLDRTRDLADALAREHSEAGQTQAILQSIGEGVIVFDQNGQAIVANPTVYALLECGESDLLGHDISAVMAQAVSTEDQAIIRSVVEDERPAHAGLKIAWGNRTVAINFAPVNLPFVNEHGTLVVLRDVTKEAQVDRMKSEFVSIVSHELRTPMTAIKGYVDLLAMGTLGTVTERQREFLTIVKTNADRLSEMVNELLDLSRIEAGKVQMHYQAVSLPRVVHEVAVMLQKNFDDQGIQLQLDVPDTLPDVLSDPGRLTQIVTNLLSNALKYTFQGRVEVMARAAGRHVQVDIADTGIGMTEEDQAKLFTRFFRASTARSREISGTGLGLSITRSLIEMQGGRIWVKSAVDQGSAFSFTIPVLPEPLVHMAPTEPPPAVVVRPQAVPHKILIVHNQARAAQSFRRQLERGGYSSLITTHAADVLPLARREQPDLILLDVTLSDMDGFDLLRQLTQSPETRSIPVIVTSTVADEAKSLALGAAGCLADPIGDYQLLASVQRVLAASHLEQETLRSVLVVDDEADVRHWLALELSNHGFGVVEAEDGQAALAAIAARRPHIIVLDLKMPNMDGWTVIRRLKENPQAARLPIIVLTASPVDMQQEKARVLEMGVDRFLVKPLSIQALIAEINRQLAP